jgi:hypothetical protein
VQRLIPRRRWTAPAHDWAARRVPAPHRLGNALEQPLRLASPICPPRGSRRKAPAPLRSARATRSCHPQTPSRGSADRSTPRGKRLCRSCRFLVRLFAPPWTSPNRGRRPPRCAGSLGLRLALCGLSSLLAWVRNVLPQDSCVKATAVWTPARAGWRTRRASVLADAARAWAGGQRGGHGPPHPSPVAALRCRSNGLLLAGLCAAGHRGRARAPSPDRQPWQRGPWRWPAPGSRTRLPIAAALFLPPQDAQCNPGGATSRAGLAALGAHAHP